LRKITYSSINLLILNKILEPHRLTFFADEEASQTPTTQAETTTSKVQEETTNTTIGRTEASATQLTQEQQEKIKIFSKQFFEKIIKKADKDLDKYGRAYIDIKFEEFLPDIFSLLLNNNNQFVIPIPRLCAEELLKNKPEEKRTDREKELTKALKEQSGDQVFVPLTQERTTEILKSAKEKGRKIDKNPITDQEIIDFFNTHILKQINEKLASPTQSEREEFGISKIQYRLSAEGKYQIVLERPAQGKTLEQEFPETQQYLSEITDKQKVQEIPKQNNEKLVLVSRNPDNQGKPQELAVYQIDKDGKMKEARYYDKDGKLLRIEEPPKDKKKTVGDLIGINYTTGEEVRITEEFAQIIKSAKKEEKEGKGISMYKLWWDNLRDLLMMWNEVKCWALSTFEAPIAYNSGKKLSDEKKLHFALCKYGLNKDYAPEAVRIFKQKLTVAEFISDGPNNNSEWFFNDPADYRKFKDDPQNNPLTDQVLDEEKIRQHIYKLKRKYEEIKKYPQTETLIKLFKTLLLNTNENFIIPSPEIQQRDKNLAKKLTDSSYFKVTETATTTDKDKKTETSTITKDLLPDNYQNLTLRNFLGSDEQINKIMLNGKVDDKEFEKHLKSIPNKNGENTLYEELKKEPQGLSTARTAYEKIVKTYFPKYQYISDFFAEKVSGQDNGKKFLPGKYKDSSFDGILDYDEFSKTEEKETNDGVVKTLQENTFIIDGENITLTPGIAQIISAMPASHFLYSAEATRIDVELVTGQNNTLGHAAFYYMQKLSKDFREKFPDDYQTKKNDFQKITTAELFEQKNYLASLEKAESTENFTKLMLGEIPAENSATDNYLKNLYISTSIDELIINFEEMPKNGMEILYSLKPADFFIFAGGKGKLDPEIQKKLKGIPPNIAKYITLKYAQTLAETGQDFDLSALSGDSRTIGEIVLATDIKEKFLLNLFKPLEILAKITFDATNTNYLAPYKNFITQSVPKGMDAKTLLETENDLPYLKTTLN